jgi:ferritin-like metal-binding protein YciE
MKLNSLHELFVHELQDLYSAETQLVEALPKMVGAAHSPELKSADPTVKDAGLIVAAQKVEHYEIASYGSCCVFAETLGFDRVKQILKETLSEEEATDKKLTHLAESVINVEAAMK